MKVLDVRLRILGFIFRPDETFLNVRWNVSDVGIMPKINPFFLLVALRKKQW